MPESAHTPGPWHTNRGCVWAKNPNCPSDTLGIADCRTVDAGGDVEANARIIAAAPAMLAALKAALILEPAIDETAWYSSSQYPNVFRAIKAAIAQAEGKEAARA